MHQPVIGPGQSGQNDDTDSDDIEWELCCSAREASVGYVPFANLDFSRAAMEVCQRRMEELRRDSPSPVDSTGLEQCPECSGKMLISVCAAHSTNFFCRNCALCWHVENGRAKRVNPWTCPGCQLVTTACFERFELVSASVSS